MSSTIRYNRRFVPTVHLLSSYGLSVIGFWLGGQVFLKLLTDLHASEAGQSSHGITDVVEIGICPKWRGSTLAIFVIRGLTLSISDMLYRFHLNRMN